MIFSWKPVFLESSLSPIIGSPWNIIWEEKFGHFSIGWANQPESEWVLPGKGGELFIEDSIASNKSNNGSAELGKVSLTLRPLSRRTSRGYISGLNPGCDRFSNPGVLDDSPICLRIRAGHGNDEENNQSFNSSLLSIFNKISDDMGAHQS